MQSFHRFYGNTLYNKIILTFKYSPHLKAFVCRFWEMQRGDRWVRWTVSVKPHAWTAHFTLLYSHLYISVNLSLLLCSDSENTKWKGEYGADSLSVTFQNKLGFLWCPAENNPIIPSYIVSTQPRESLFTCYTSFHTISFPYPQSSSTLWNYSKCGVYTVESEAGC
jgi:hypothetical protein